MARATIWCRRNHLRTHGSHGVLEELRFEEIGRGQPSEQGQAVVAEHVAREEGTSDQLAGPGAALKMSRECQC